jgi:hypothetical protein
MTVMVVMMLTTTIMMMTTMIMITTATEEDCFIPSNYNKQRFRMFWYFPAKHRRAHPFVPYSSFSGAGVRATLDASHSSSITYEYDPLLLPVSLRCLAWLIIPP